jgi:hypothetical protein
MKTCISNKKKKKETSLQKKGKKKKRKRGTTKGIEETVYFLKFSDGKLLVMVLVPTVKRSQPPFFIIQHQ